jgi:hypothetical protein
MDVLSRPIIIIGSGRSGTTIISEIIFSHEDLAWPSNYQTFFPKIPFINSIRLLFQNRFWNMEGKKKQLNKVAPLNFYLFRPVEAYKFWETITGKRINFSREFLLHKTATEKEKQTIRRHFEKMVKYQRKKRLAFKLTGPARMGYLLSIFPDAYFVNVVREPFPTILSWLNVDFWEHTGKHQLWWQGAYSNEELQWAEKNTNHPALLAALQYKKIQDTTLEEIRKYNPPCITVTYENFVENPKDVIHEIFDFVKLPRSSKVDNYLKKNIIFNQNKKADLSSSFPPEEITIMNQILSGTYSFKKEL